MILIYEGEGKGKTCACIGQALRALGHGFPVVFAQFIKRPNQAGEQKMLELLLKDNFRAGGAGFIRNDAELEMHRQKALDLLAWTERRSWRLLVLDELLNALHRKLLGRGEVEPLLKRGSHESAHIVVSGRRAPAWILEMADLITKFHNERHPHDIGVPAVAGIEF